jgi:hypothetical protein
VLLSKGSGVVAELKKIKKQTSVIICNNCLIKKSIYVYSADFHSKNNRDWILAQDIIREVEAKSFYYANYESSKILSKIISNEKKKLLFPEK